MFADPIEILRQYWGYSSFRPQQEDIIRSVMLGNDTLAMMPTGGGKSLCFQVPALCMPGICVVVSPLVALMKDQVERLHRMDIKAHLVTSALTKKETDYILDNCVQGPIKFLYVSPERLQNELFIERFKRMKVNIIAVDEAHCISQWGHDFRPAYRKISELRQFHPKVNVIAVTASATPEVADDILSQLAMRDPAVFSLPMKRSNLHYAVVEESDTMARLVRVCRKNQGTGIVYAGTRRGVKAAAEYLNAHGIDAKYYHAGLTTSEKEIVQQQWMSGKTRVICATNAFGMGIDKADVRFVVHTQLPDNLENYVQEAGRGGRDGKDAWAILLWNNSQRTDYQENLKRRFPPKERVRETYLHLCNFFDLAYGSGLDVSVSFDVSDFAKRYKRTLSEVYFELEILELAGVISLSEGALLPTRVMFKMQANVLYDFQVRNPKFDAFIRLLLRSYGGLFEGFAKIDVYALAKNTGWTVQQVEQTLRQLENFEVLYYQPAATHPTLTFLIARQEHTNLIIPSVAYESRKERMESRFDAVQHYLTASCREQFIAHYFGDTEASTCGHCDVCVDKKKQHSSLQDDLL
ncbi:MAG: ATP-dependent helicase recQ, partial [Bacteroidota bacterium]